MIELLESRIAPAIFVVTTTADSGPGSLRQAIIDANADTIADAINFNIAGTSVRTIFLQSSLPSIVQPVTIDGYTQPGSSANTLPVGTNAVIQIEIDGSDLIGRDGLNLNSASNVTIRGLAIFGFDDDSSINGNSIRITGNSSNVTVAGCFLGTDATGLGGARNRNEGIDLGTAVSNITIGGSAVADRNLISNNISEGIEVRGTNIVIKGNLIGTGPDGVTPLPNGAGIALGFITNATIGGLGTEQNVIANNNRDGIEFFSTSSGVNILPNSFFRNGGLAIDFGSNGVTPNDPLDADTGQNSLQNFPVITDVNPTDSPSVSFALDSTPNGTFRIDFYASTSPDPTGFGEGQTFLTSVFVFTDSAGHIEGSIPLPSPIANGTTITATTTNLTTQETSEFSRGFNINNIAFPNDKTATWIDSDGDRVTLKITKGALSGENFFFGSGVVQDGQILHLLQLTTEEFNGTNITVSVKKVAGGDGRIEVGFIDATARDLGNVIIPGDLGRFICGDADTTTLSLRNLKVKSFGVAGTQTLPDGLNQSVITGAAGSILVASDFRDVAFRLTSLDGSPEEIVRTRIETLKIGGDLSSDRPTNGAQINLFGSIKALSIAGSLIGGGNGGGDISVSNTVGKVTFGNVHNASAALGTSSNAEDVAGKLTIKGDLAGGSILTGLAIKQITVLGSVIGTFGGGSIVSSADLTKVVIGGDLVGARAFSNQFISNTGIIQANGSIDQVIIAGSVIGGTTSGSASNIRSGAIRAGDVLGSVVIGGDTIGSSNSPVVISGVGAETKPTEGLDVAIRSVVIKGNAINTQILGGFLPSGTPANADASIGSVKVGRNWIGSSIVAGAQDAGAPGFGAGDVLQTVDDTALVAKIASIAIRGSFLPGITPLLNFGFVAQEIGKVQVGSFKTTLTEGPSNDDLTLGAFSNLHLLEV
jgi:hypothetical protein